MELGVLDAGSCVHDKLLDLLILRLELSYRKRVAKQAAIDLEWLPMLIKR